jgi:5-methylcytosine-specific restriction endonuclease McrA
MQCKQCGDDLTGRQTAYCSRKCRKMAEYVRDAQAYKDRAKRNRRERAARDPDAFRAYNRERAKRLYAADPAKVLARRKARYEQVPEQYRAYARQAYWRNPEPYRVRALLRIKADPSGYRLYQRERYYADPEASRLRSKQSRARRRDKIRAYEAANRDRRIAHTQTRRAKRRGNGGSYTVKQWRALCAQYDHRCLACGEVKRLTPDHVIPLALGGSSDIRNIQPLCLPCNWRKSVRTTDYRNAPVWTMA